MKEIKLEVKTRHNVGTSVAKRLRKNGKIPAVVYGAGEKPIPLELEQKNLLSILRSGLGENVIINLNIDDEKKEKKVLIKEIQHDPVWGDILHVDFQQISMKKKIKLSIPLHLVGTAIGVDEGGILQHATRELEIECLPTDIPEKVEVDVSELNIGDAIHVRDLKLEKVVILSDSDTSVVSVVPPTVFKEEVKVVEEEVAEPEVVGEEAEKVEEAKEEKEVKAEKKEEVKGEKKEAKAEKKEEKKAPFKKVKKEEKK